VTQTTSAVPEVSGLTTR